MSTTPIDLISICTNENVPFIDSGHHHAHEGWIQLHCPYCTDGTHGWHLGWSLEFYYFNCWRCGKVPTIKTLCEITHKNYTAVKKLIEDHSVLHYKTKTKKIIRKKKAEPPSGMTILKKQHKLYLKKRKFPSTIIKEWNIKATTSYTDNGWEFRIITPIKDRDGNVIAYTGRTISKERKPRWKTTENKNMTADPKTLLYGIEKIKDSVLIVEGPSDVWRMGPGAVGTLGIDWHVEQANILRSISNRFIMFDNQPQAQKRARELADFLSVYPGETEIITGLSTDPGDLSQKEANKIMIELGIKK